MSIPLLYLVFSVMVFLISLPVIRKTSSSYKTWFVISIIVSLIPLVNVVWFATMVDFLLSDGED